MTRPELHRSVRLAERGHLYEVTAKLDRNALVQPLDMAGDCLLMHLRRASDARVISSLLTACMFRRRRKDGMTAAHFAAINGWLCVPVELGLVDCDLLGWRIKPRESTALMFVHEAADARAVVPLLKRNLLLMSNSMGQTAAHFAVKEGWIGELGELLDCELMDCTTRSGATVWDFCRMYGTMRLVPDFLRVARALAA